MSLAGVSPAVQRSSTTNATRRPLRMAARAELSKPKVSAEAARPEKPRAPAPATTSTPPPARQPMGEGVTVEYQRAQAKEMTKYFKRLKIAETQKNAPWVSAIFKRLKYFVISFACARWYSTVTPSPCVWLDHWQRDQQRALGMFGLLVGGLTEYATGVDFIDQIKLMGALFGIVDTD
eukprot:CAMPEP_0117684736 /NCGR_PEP_ID=MMETSP0804-20121206/21291_1 /TAXON_ID=1074897 /ORGANISM="Tetraselmis astigmatica, Strain CCMP880" /LENGTH=177 /DNA_ID=CAMNT_0005495813 /DNA_START=280 /DNA_END=814 /DNA_ORIENTATION=-